ncbi:MAG TPA: tetratricopeptide repeat protein [Bryobacteraceae bacterium]|nr:tetratricopeptide repeat protein [Bryobacteraceae bacterium]
MSVRWLTLMFAACAMAQEAKPVLTPETRGDIYMARKMYREAIESFREGSPKDPVLLNKTGIAYHQMMQLDTARKYYEQAIKLKPDYTEAINNIGTVYYAKKSFRRAITWYKRALKFAPDDPKSASIYMNLGTAEFARKQYQRATADYQTAMRLDPNVFEHHSSTGILLEERSVEERAKFHFYVAKLYAKTGRNDLAIQYLRKSLEEGFKDKKKLEDEPDFAGIKELPEFKELMAREQRVL